MAMLLLRYRTSKQPHGQFSFELHGGAQVLGFAEHWHTEKGWEVHIDVLSDSREPVERRYFMLAASGSNLTALGEVGAHYHVASYTEKGYASHLFELTHLSETEREQLRVDNPRLWRPAPSRGDMERTLSRTEREHLERRDRARQREREQRAAERFRTIGEAVEEKADASADAAGGASA